MSLLLPVPLKQFRKISGLLLGTGPPRPVGPYSLAKLTKNFASLKGCLDKGIFVSILHWPGLRFVSVGPPWHDNLTRTGSWDPTFMILVISLHKLRPFRLSFSLFLLQLGFLVGIPTHSLSVAPVLLIVLFVSGIPCGHFVLVFVRFACHSYCQEHETSRGSGNEKTSCQNLLQGPSHSWMASCQGVSPNNLRPHGRSSRSVCSVWLRAL